MSSRWLRVVWCSGLLLALAACAPAPSANPSAPAAPPAAMATAAPAGSGGAVDQAAVERLIVREGTLNLVVDDPLAARATIEGWVGEMSADGAFVVSGNEYGGGAGQAPSISLSIRIPVARFDATMDRIAALGREVRQRQETAQDVTAEYVDVQARIEALETARQRLLTIMQDAKNTEDLLQAEQQLTQREADLNALKGREQFLSESAALSKIDISLTPSALAQPVDIGGWRIPETARDAIDDLLSTVQGFTRFVVYFVIAILPWLVFWGLIIYIMVRLVRRWLRRPSAAAAPKAPQPPAAP
jgi:hypothetical protein